MSVRGSTLPRISGQSAWPAAVVHVVAQPRELLRVERAAIGQNHHAGVAQRFEIHGRLGRLDHLEGSLHFAGNGGGIGLR